MQKIFTVQHSTKPKALECRIRVVTFPRKLPQSQHPDFEDAPARVVTAYSIDGYIGGENVFGEEATSEVNCLERIKTMEMDITRQCIARMETPEKESFEQKLEKLGFKS